MSGLYHVTRRQDWRSIKAKGLRYGSEIAAVKEVQDVAGGEIDPHHQPKEVQADREFDELIADARRAVEGADQFPRHDEAVFAWPSKMNARQSAKNMSFNTAVVAIDPERAPGLKFAVGDTDEINHIWTEIYGQYSDRRSGTPADELFDDAKRWWRDVEWYSGGSSRQHEAWTGNNIPPKAITGIIDMENDEVLWDNR
jgi:hypothetical protein